MALARIPAREATLTMLPARASLIVGKTAFIHCQGALTLVARTSSNTVSSYSSVRVKGVPSIPMLLTRHVTGG
ncbi:hypothetical protein D3C78_1566020 [compost metagenome]